MSTARVVAIVAVMSALGNALSLMSLPIAPGVEIHFTQLPALLVAVSLGPVVGAMCGFLSTLLMALKIATFSAMFIPVGNTILCFAAGLLAKKLWPIVACPIAELIEWPFIYFTCGVIAGLPAAVVWLIATKSLLEVSVDGAIIELLQRKYKVVDLIRARI